MSEPRRRRMPDNRPSLTRKCKIERLELYIIVGFYPGTSIPGELFIKGLKFGSDTLGMLQGFAVMVSMALQYGVRWSSIKDKFFNVPFGTGDLNSKSVLDCIVKGIDHLIAVRQQVIQSSSLINNKCKRQCPECNQWLTDTAFNKKSSKVCKVCRGINKSINKLNIRAKEQEKIIEKNIKSIGDASTGMIPIDNTETPRSSDAQT